MNDRREIQKIGYAQTSVVAVFLVAIVFIANQFLPASSESGNAVAQAAAIGVPQAAAAGNDDCKVPDWAIAMGHADKWKLHHNCK